MFVHGVLLAVHHNLLNERYEVCKAALVVENDYTVEKAMKCAKKSKAIKIIATLINEEGSALEGSDD
jgi:hypothetical protein